MKNFKLKKQILCALVLSVTMLFTSCNDSGEIKLPQDPKKETIKTLARKVAGPKAKTANKGEESFVQSCVTAYNCFKFIFPLEVTKGKDKVKINSEEELAKFNGNLDPGVESYFVFPIKIQYFGGAEETEEINDYVGLTKAYDSCKERTSLCYYLNFPLEVTDGNSKQKVNNDFELANFYQNVSDPTKINFIYPVKVTYVKTKEIVTIKDSDQFDNAFKDCSSIADYEFLDTFRCFIPSLPIKVTSAKGEELTINTHKEFTKYFKDQKKAGKTPKITFPIEVILADDSFRYIYSFAQLEALFDMCFDKELDVADCFLFNYPITLIKAADKSEVAVNNNKELYDFVEKLGANNYFDFKFPLTIAYNGEKDKKINSQEELDTIFNNCK